MSGMHDKHAADRQLPATYAGRAAARERRDAPIPPPAPRARRAGSRARRPGPVLRAHVEQIGEPRVRPDLLLHAPGETVLEVVGPRASFPSAVAQL